MMNKKYWLLIALFCAVCCGAESPLSQYGVEGGLVVCVGGGEKTSSLWKSPGTVFQCLETSDAAVSKVRKKIREAGCYGRVSADLFDGKRLPYTDNLVNLVVASGKWQVAGEEFARVLAPRGVLLTKNTLVTCPSSLVTQSPAPNGWHAYKKAVPPEIDDWSHFLHNASGNPVGQDKRVGPPRQLQWEDEPRGTRSHEKMSSVSVAVTSGGRVFSIMDEGPLASVYLPSKWSLSARDAFNGIVLWKKPIPVWHTQLFPLKSGPFQLTRRLVAVGDRVYVTLGLYELVSEIDAATGEILRTFAGTEYTEEIIYSNGKLVLVVNNRKEPIPYKYKQPARNPGFTIAVQAESRSLVAIDTASGKTLWSKEGGGITPLTAISDGAHVFFHSDDMVRCLDIKSGKELWKQPKPRKQKLATNSNPGFFVHDGVVCFAETKSLTGFSVKDGRQLWNVNCSASVYRSPLGVCVIDGMIWIPESPGWISNRKASGLLVGYDLKTGKRAREIPIDVEQGVGVCHHRCSMPKAVDKYLLTSWPGVEFTDTTTGKMRASHWVRGACLFGSMPANGLIYAPPNPCACYPEAKLHGYLALAPESKGNDGGEVADSKRLIKGAVFGTVKGKNDPGSWPTLRGDNKRSGGLPISVSASPKKKWSKKLGGKLTQPVVAGGKLFVASVDTHEVIALDAKTGNLLWSFTAGARIDSSPTIHKGMAIFGCRDGFVYCLAANSGKLVWKFFAAVNDRRLVSCGQLESLWPVPGSVLIQDGSLYFASGKSGFLTGGITLYRLNPATGERLAKTRLDLLGPDGRQTTVDWLSMPGALPDVLSSDGEYVYMRHIAFDLDGKRVDHPGNDHLYSSNGFVDRSEFHRTFMKLGQGSLEARIGVPTGPGRGSKFISMDKDRLYHYGRAKAITAALKDGEEYFLSATSRTATAPKPETAEKKTAKRRKGRKNKKKAGKAGGANDVWNQELPMYVRAMVLADDILFVAGAKGDWSHADEVFEGRQGVTLLAVSAADGKTLGETPLVAFPIFDGMSVAYGNLFVADDSGTVSCFK